MGFIGFFSGSGTAAVMLYQANGERSPKQFTNMKTVNITLFAFNELNATAQQKAISEHLEFMDSLPEEYENEEGKMVSEYIEHTETDAYESINANDYLFFTDGTLASVTHFSGKHPRAGQAELTLHGETVSWVWAETLEEFFPA